MLDSVPKWIKEKVGLFPLFFSFPFSRGAIIGSIFFFFFFTRLGEGEGVYRYQCFTF